MQNMVRRAYAENRAKGKPEPLLPMQLLGKFILGLLGFSNDKIKIYEHNKIA